MALVRDFATLPGWSVTMTSKGQWTTAERVLKVGGRQWVVGLTPTTGDATALMLWADEILVTRVRGDERALCRTACQWVGNLLAGRAWDAGTADG